MSCVSLSRHPGLQAAERPPIAAARRFEALIRACIVPADARARRRQEVLKMKLHFVSVALRSIGRFAVAAKRWLVGGPGDDARIASLYRYRDGSQRPCPGPYALLAGVADR